MSDVVTVNDASQTQDAALGVNESVETVRSFGALLAAEREKQGLAVTDIAARLRFHPRQILALEQEDLAALPAAPFLRGFLRNYARELKLDSKPLLEALDAKLGVTAGDASSQATPDVEKALIKSVRPPTIQTLARERVSRTTVVAGVVGALVVLTAIGLIASNRAKPVSVQAQGQSEVAPKKVEAPSTATAEAAAPASSTQSEPAALPAGTSLPATDSAQVAPEAAAATPVSPPTPAVPQTPTTAPAPLSPPTAATTGLHLKFEEPAWVEVTQGDGKLLLSQLNEAGTEKVLIGAPPLRAVIGNASGVTVEYRGRAIDLKPVTSVDNVARITLK